MSDLYEDQGGRPVETDRGQNQRHHGDFAERIGKGLKSANDLLTLLGGATANGRKASSAPSSEASVEGLAQQIAQVASRLLNRANMDPDADFFNAGGSSVNAVELVSVLTRELGVEVTLDDVFADARPRRLAQRWLGQGRAMVRDLSPVSVEPVHELRTRAPSASHEKPDNIEDTLQLVAQDLALADQIPWVSAGVQSVPRRILLTGATGFLGSHLLFDLLRQGEAHVVCLVRASSDEAAVERLAQCLRERDLPWSSELRRRITVVAGDVSKASLGWDARTWDEMAQSLDAIVHVAATVDFVRGYASMREANVWGPLTLASLAASARVKHLLHISTISIFDEVGIGAIAEDGPVARIDRLHAGYEQTKWAAEMALRRVQDRGVPVTVCRPGGIGGHTETGVYNPFDLSTGFMAAWQQLRMLPEFRYMNVAPVDWVSRVTAEIALDPEAWGYNYHLSGRPLGLREVMREMTLAGMNVRVYPYEEWRQHFLSRMERDPIEPLQFLQRVLSVKSANKLVEATLTAPAARAERTDAYVKRRKLPKAQPFSAQMMVAMSERLQRDGRSRLPGREDPPYLQFKETVEGVLCGEDGREANCRLDLRVSVASFYQVFTERRVDLRGQVECALLDAEPLLVETGDFWVRPNDGVPAQHGNEYPLLRYAMSLKSKDGQRWWMKGMKYARSGWDQWSQGRTLEIDVGVEGEPASLHGTLVIPAKSYVPDQIKGLTVHSSVPAQEHGAAKLIWLAWLGSQFAIGFSEPLLRSLARLLDLSPGRTSEEPKP